MIAITNRKPPSTRSGAIIPGEPNRQPTTSAPVMVSTPVSTARAIAEEEAGSRAAADAPVRRSATIPPIAPAPTT